MKTTISIIVILAVIIGGYFAMKSGSVKNASESAESAETSALTASSTYLASTTAVTVVPVISNSKKIAFSEFMKKGGSYKCTVNQYLGVVGGPSTKGTTYINDKMVRAEYSTKIQDKDVSTNLIVKDGFTYMWSSISPTMGFKVKAVIHEATSSAVAASGSYSFNASQIGDYDCQPWTTDASMFSLPTGVTFKEI